jgi:hypothetical protein
MAEAKAPTDIVVRQLRSGIVDRLAHAFGPVFITVVGGHVTFYERDDPTCTGKVVRAGWLRCLGGFASSAPGSWEHLPDRG